jgi:hypothetical protein
MSPAVPEFGDFDTKELFLTKQILTFALPQRHEYENFSRFDPILIQNLHL